MSLLGRLRQALAPAPPRPGTCALCVSFDNDPQVVEAAMPGLRTLGSGAASVRAGDGLCARHGRYLSDRASCTAFQAR